MFQIANNQQEKRYTNTLTRFCHWLIEKQSNSNPATQSVGKKTKQPSFSECLDFCNRQESI